jgi:hypothetical protein
MKRTAEVKRDARIGEAEAQRDAGIKVKFSFKQDFVSFIFFFRCTQYPRRVDNPVNCNNRHN